MLKQNHLENIDFIKGLAAISVILLHTLPESFLYGSIYGKLYLYFSL